MATLLVSNAARADSLRADLDGDGVHDRIESTRRAGELAVHFSTTHRWQRLRANDFVLNFVVTDVNRDGDPDLVVNTRGSGLRIWINKGRGLFSSSSRRLKSHRLRFTRWSGPLVRGIQSLRYGDSVLNDPTRLFTVWSTAPRAHLVAVCRAPPPARAALTKFTRPRPTPRGPPLFLNS